MCGIAGVFSYRDDTRPVDRSELLKMRDHMVNRGPDGAGIWLDAPKSIGLAHRRLAILDLTEAGAQPMATRDGKLRITFNGEIYNYREIRDSLKAKGHVFISGSDTEVLLYAYREYGRSMVDHLRGMFAFAIWDEQKRGLFMARDHFGIKPLYYHDDGDSFRFASQVKAILAGGGINEQTNPAGLVGFYLWGCVPEPYTLYRNLFALSAGHSIWVDGAGPRTPLKYFDIAEELGKAGETKAEGHAEEVLRTALRDSVKYHLISDVPVGVFLSSGLDSSTLTNLVAQKTNRVQAVTLGFKEYKGSSSDEVPLAKKIATLYGCTHHVGLISRRDFQEELPSIFQAMDQPSIDGINAYFVSRAARSAGLKVAISGLGGDELLSGYPSFRNIPTMVSSLRPFSFVPGLGSLLRIALSPMKYFTSPKFASLFEYGGSYGGSYLLRRGLYMPWELPQFLDGEVVREGWATLQPIVRLDEWLKPVGSPKAKVAAMEFSLYMRNMLLRDADWAGMAHSLEIRVPFVDITLFRTLAPYISDSSNPLSKRILGGCPNSPLPEEILNRPKTGFAIPVREWVEGQGMTRGKRGLRGWAEVVMSEYQVIKVRKKHFLVLVTDAFGGRGGIAKFNRDLLWAISASPAVGQVTAIPRLVVESPCSPPLKLRYELSGINGKFAYIRAVWKIIRDSIGMRTEIVLCGHINLLPLAWLSSRIMRAPLWCVIHGIDAWQANSNWLCNRLVQKLDGVISVSETTRQRFVNWSGVPLEKVHILSNCYDPSIFFPAPRSTLFIERYGLQNKTVLMTVGRLGAKEQYKGFDEVIEILPDLMREIPNVIYMVIGDGDDKPRLRKKVLALGLQDRVVFVGYANEAEKADLYRLADVYVMPSHGEGFGVVFLEAMACGVPAIGSKLDGSREALAGGRLGMIVDPNYPDEILAAIRASLGKGEGRQPEGLEEFSLSNYKHRVWELFGINSNAMDGNISDV